MGDSRCTTDYRWSRRPMDPLPSLPREACARHSQAGPMPAPPVSRPPQPKPRLLEFPPAPDGAVPIIVRPRRQPESRERLLLLAEKSHAVAASIAQPAARPLSALAPIRLRRVQADAPQRHSTALAEPPPPLPSMGLRAKDKCARESAMLPERRLPEMKEGKEKEVKESVSDRLSNALRALRPGALVHSASSSAPFAKNKKSSGGAVVEADDMVYIRGVKEDRRKGSPLQQVQREERNRKAKSVFVRSSPSQSDLLQPVRDPTLRDLDHIRSLYKSVPNVNMDDEYSREDDVYSSRSPTDSGYRSTPRHLTDENPYVLDDESGVHHKTTTVVHVNACGGADSPRSATPSSPDRLRLRHAHSPALSQALSATSPSVSHLRNGSPCRQSPARSPARFTPQQRTPRTTPSPAMRPEHHRSSPSLHAPHRTSPTQPSPLTARASPARVRGPSPPRLPFSERDVLAVLQARRCKPFGHYIHLAVIPKIVQLMSGPLTLLTENLQRLSAYMIKMTIEEVQTAVKISFPLDVFSSCLKAGMQATTLFALSGTGALRKSLSARADLRLSVGHFYRWLIEHVPNKPISDSVAVFTTAVVECVLEELVLRLVDSDNSSVISLGEFEKTVGDDLLQYLADTDSLSRSEYHSPFTFNELIDIVHSIRKHVLMETDGSLGGKGKRRSKIQLSRSGIRSLHYYVCMPGQYRERRVPLADWVRLIYAFAEHRSSSTVDDQDVQQAARTLLPSCDCAPPSVEYCRRDLPPDATPQDARTALAFSLISTGQVENVHAAAGMLDGEHLSTKNAFGLCPLSESVVQTNLDAVTALLSCGCPVNTAVPSPSIDKRPLLLSEYAGWTPLNWAVGIQKANLVSMLLNARAQVEREEMGKDSPIQLATQLSSSEIVSLLLREGADPFRSSVVYDSLHADFRQIGCPSALAIAAARGNAELCETYLGKISSAGSQSVSVQDFLQHAGAGREGERSEFDQLGKDTRLALQEALYYAVETLRPQIALRLKNSVNGLNWNVHIWTAALRCALSQKDRPVIDQLLTDFGPRLAAELSQENIDETVAVLTAIVRWECRLPSTASSSAAFTLSRLHHYFCETASTGDEPRASFSRAAIDPSFVNNPELSDVRFVVAGRPIYGHRIVLVNSSDKMRKLLASPEGEIRIDDVSHDTFLGMMEFLYTGKLEAADKSVDALFCVVTAAEQYGLPQLKEVATHALANRIDGDNFAQLYHYAIMHGVERLLARCERFLLENFGSLCSDERVRQLVVQSHPHYDVCSALSSRIARDFDRQRNAR